MIIFNVQKLGLVWMRRFGLAIILLGTFSAEALLAQPITFPTSMSVGDKDLFVRVQPWYSRSTNDPSGQSRKLTEWNIRLMSMYGFTSKTALFVVAPYIDRTWEAGGLRSNSRGFGDVELFLRRTVIEKNWTRRTFSVSPFVGVKLPIGEEAQMGFPEWYTLGSGSADYLIGFAIRDATLGKPHRFFSARYTFNTEANGFERGDTFEINAAIKPGLTSWETQRGELMGINGMLESQLFWQKYHQRGGQRVDDTGGTTWSLTPGVVYTTHRWIFEVALRVPLVQRLNGNALKNNYKVLIGVWRNF